MSVTAARYPGWGICHFWCQERFWRWEPLPGMLRALPKLWYLTWDLPDTVQVLPVAQHDGPVLALCVAGSVAPGSPGWGHRPCAT